MHNIADYAQVDGEQVDLPIQFVGGQVALDGGRDVALTTDFGLYVRFNGRSNAYVNLPVERFAWVLEIRYTYNYNSSS